MSHPSLEELNKKNTFKLLWAMYEELLEERSNSSARDSSGTIISTYAQIIDLRIEKGATDE